MPEIDGRKFFQEIKRNTTLTSIPLVVLSTSDDMKDINLSYGNLANCFITKPVNFSKFVEVVQTIEHFWIKVAKRP